MIVENTILGGPEDLMFVRNNSIVLWDLATFNPRHGF